MGIKNFKWNFLRYISYDVVFEIVVCDEKICWSLLWWYVRCLECFNFVGSIFEVFFWYWKCCVYCYGNICGWCCSVLFFRV